MCNVEGSRIPYPKLCKYIRFKSKKIINLDTPAISLAQPISTQSPFGQLWFISCGERRYQRFPFKELISVLNRSVWICVQVILAVVPVAFKYFSVDLSKGIRDIKSTYKCILPVMKVLIEQGDNLITCETYPSRLRWVSAAYILVAEVLSKKLWEARIRNPFITRVSPKQEKSRIFHIKRIYYKFKFLFQNL